MASISISSSESSSSADPNFLIEIPDANRRSISSKQRRATFGTKKYVKAMETAEIEPKINPTFNPRSAYGASSRYGSENEKENLSYQVISQFLRVSIKTSIGEARGGFVFAYCTAILKTDAVLYVMSRMEVLGISALRICAVGAQPNEYPNVNTTIMAIMPALILSEGLVAVPRPPMVMQEAI